ncbi:hypothetical protein DFH29DRAFT_135211 [Suillus ampliporus]|nr:hypothetical protein DFH29DRAFT_135211 [Suillus ampliporus]
MAGPIPSRTDQFVRVLCLAHVIISFVEAAQRNSLRTYRRCSTACLWGSKPGRCQPEHRLCRLDVAYDARPRHRLIRSCIAIDVCNRPETCVLHGSCRGAERRMRQVQ